MSELNNFVSAINEAIGTIEGEPGSYELYSYPNNGKHCYSLNLNNKGGSTRAIVFNLVRDQMEFYLIGMLYGVNHCIAAEIPTRR